MSMAIDDAYFDRLADTIIDGDDEECVRLIREGLETSSIPWRASKKAWCPESGRLGTISAPGSFSFRS